VTSPIVTLATCADYSTLDDDDQGLPDALRERGIVREGECRGTENP